ncbi:MAG: hypothetical protein RL021_1864 [Bacteroidota bacterium]
MKPIVRTLSFIFCLLATSCALQIAPQGGERDTRPPVLQRAIPPSGTTGFDAKEVVFEFDEYLQLKDVASKLVVSPPLRQNPVVKVRKNRLIMELEDTLHAATTYTFNFGDAIADLNEGNTYPELTYVVATGSVLDTLRMSGSVQKAEDLKPEKGMLVMLYPSGSEDSIPYQERPLYFSKTDDLGNFTVQNIAPGSYRLFALVDGNSNYIYDDPSERIAFLQKEVTPPDSALRLASFKKSGPVKLSRAAADGPGKVALILSRPDSLSSIRLLSDSVRCGVRNRIASALGDTLYYWYTDLMTDSMTFEVRLRERTDTIQVRLSRLDTTSIRKRAAFQFAVEVPAAASGLQPTHLPLQFRTNHPIESFDTSLVSIARNGVPVPLPAPSLSNPTTLQFDVPWEEEQPYEVLVDPGAFRDIFQLKNDTLRFRFTTNASTDYGSLRVSMNGVAASGSSVLLLVSDDDRPIRKAVFASDTVCLFEHIVPGNYRLKRVDDRNNNGQWDSGDDLLRMQPEAVIYYADPVPVRANWDVEVKWNLADPSGDRRQ